MRQKTVTAARRSDPEAFFKFWIATTVLVAAYVIGVSAFVSDMGMALWLIGAPVAAAKALLVGSGLGFLVWFVFLRRPHGSSMR